MRATVRPLENGPPVEDLAREAWLLERAADGDAGFATPQAAGGAGSADPIDVRTNFDALAIFEPEVTTDAAGTATIEVPLPDSLTRYRVMVVAVDGIDVVLNNVAQVPLARV